jgi:hypothetical protein
VPLAVSFPAEYYQVGVAIPMLIGTCGAAVSVVLRCWSAPETKGKELVPDLTVT